MNTRTNEGTPPAAARLFEMAWEYWASQIVRQVVEMVIPAGDGPRPGKLLDMMMLVGPGGQERTPSEYEALLAANGLRMTRIVPTASPVSIVEAVRA
jgi:hypothetical protein